MRGDHRLQVVDLGCLFRLYNENLPNTPLPRVGPIYQLADIFGRYRYIGIGKQDIGIGHIGIGIFIGYSEYWLYRYRPNIG